MVIDKVLIKIYIISIPLIIEGGITTNLGIKIIGQNWRFISQPSGFMLIVAMSDKRYYVYFFPCLFRFHNLNFVKISDTVFSAQQILPTDNLNPIRSTWSPWSNLTIQHVRDGVLSNPISIVHSSRDSFKQLQERWESVCPATAGRKPSRKWAVSIPYSTQDIAVDAQKWKCGLKYVM